MHRCCQQGRPKIKKRGFFYRKTGRCRRVQRYQCKACKKWFCKLSGTARYRQIKPHLNPRIFRLLGDGMSQRACARVLGIHRTTVARKLRLLGQVCRQKNSKAKPRTPPTLAIVFDEMETFEHSKCKPLAIALAVEEKSRHIVSVHVSKMPPKGRLARVSYRRYGFRKDCRRQGLVKLMKEVKVRAKNVRVFKSDQCPRYPAVVRKYFPNAIHQTFKGRRACVVGQGELKAGGFDPLFSLNHSCAMYRDHLKRLTRRSWCTTKKQHRLQDLLDIYARYHNQQIAGMKKLVTL